MDKIGVGFASVTELEKKYVLDALDNERLSQGKYVNKFEKNFANIHRQKYGVMCNSGTSALHLALEVLKESSHSEVSNADLLRRLSNLEKIIYSER